mmetsp:Transcript_16332/g.24718  ORF Transcript_16332/g.24718 Transcript_16332/m.24718 type:complete len:763 (-) Transcript_16332:373-2661(-)
MSAMHRGQNGQSSATFELGAKKKFGKNLNKLQKPPAPPITNGASQRGSGSARNGLLLLSTKRSSSVGNNQGSGLLSSKSTQTSSNAKLSSQPLAIRSESYTSAHDALVDAVMGASRNDPQKEPDAWGVADKQNSSEDPVEEAENLVTVENTIPVPQKSNHSNDSPSSVDETDNGYHDQNERIDERQHDNSRNNNSRIPSESDEDRRRNQHSTNEASKNTVSNQEVFMSRLARERAELKRSEEESRMYEQRERAARRLRELEEKMGSNETPSSHSTVANDQTFLEKLGPQRHGDGEEPRNLSSRAKVTRTLFDPNRPYSSMVGGSGKKDEQETHKAQDSPSKEENVRVLHKVDDVQPSGPVIHLSSYEDRDRGEKKSSAAPRMLFDPKSGSMVAVTDNSKAKKAQKKCRRDIDNEENATSVKVNKKGKGRNESSSNQKKDRRRGDSVDATNVEDTKSPKSRKPRQIANRFPRTCGVLFSRDENGNYSSVDGCEGDQGYGCHAVPGGKVRNPAAYATFKEKRLTKDTDESPEYNFQEEEDRDQGLQGYSSSEKVEEAEQIIDWVKPNEKIELLTGIQDSPTLKPTAVPWAPSEAALAAAAAAKDTDTNEKVSKSSVSVDSGLNHSVNDEDDGVDEDSDVYVGLGFDPNNVTSLMSSPAVRAQTSKLENVDLESLGLVPPATNEKGEGQSSNIFAFGSSSTWGSVGHNSASDNWTMLGNTNRISGHVEGQDKAVSTPSFLSLSSNNTWGTSGIPGFGGDHGTAAD